MRPQMREHSCRCIPYRLKGDLLPRLEALGFLTYFTVFVLNRQPAASSLTLLGQVRKR